MPYVKVDSSDQSQAMRDLAGELGNNVKPAPDLSQKYDLEILMNVISMGILPISDNVIVYDNDMYFDGASGFFRNGALMVKGKFSPNTVLKQKRRGFFYTTPCHRGIIKVEQDDALPRAINTIGARVVSDTINVKSRGIKTTSIEEPTVQFLDSKSDHVGLSIDLPVYLVNEFAYLLSSDALDETDKVLGFPEGVYYYITRGFINDYNNVRTLNLGSETMYLRRHVQKKSKYKIYDFMGYAKLIFHYHPNPTFNLYKDVYGQNLKHKCLSDCSCFRFRTRGNFNIKWVDVYDNTGCIKVFSYPFELYTFRANKYEKEVLPDLVYNALPYEKKKLVNIPKTYFAIYKGILTPRQGSDLVLWVMSFGNVGMLYHIDDIMQLCNSILVRKEESKGVEYYATILKNLMESGHVRAEHGAFFVAQKDGFQG